MEKVEAISLTKCYSEMVHVPLIKNSLNKSPLYAISGTNGVGTTELKGLDRDPAWIIESSKSYNSPTNVRKIFLSCNKVTLQFYRPYMVNGSPSTEGCWRERAVDSRVNRGISEICSFELNQNKDLAYMGEHTPTVRFTGAMLTCIRHPWVLSNVEEIYVDATCLFSEKLLVRLGKQRVANMVQLGDVGALRNQIKPIICLLTGVQDLNILLDQLQRLKVIGIIPGLSELQTNNMIKCNCDKDNNTFIHQAIANGIVSKDSVACWVTQRAGKIDTGKLVIRPYYLFDKNILFRYEKELQRKIKADLETKIEQTKEEKRQAIEKSKTEIEKELDYIEKTQGFERALTTLRITVSFLTPEKKRELYEGLTDEAKSKYNQILR